VGVSDLTDVIVDSAFQAAMNDDLGVPAALAVIHELVTEGNTLLAKPDKGGAQLLLIVNRVRKMLAVLGVDPLSSPWVERASAADTGLRDIIGTLVSTQIAERQQAREHKDFATADLIRQRLLAAGIAIEDTPDGARWSVAEGSADHGR
jgi:cysteinyl-tRNA synthetase